MHRFLVEGVREVSSQQPRAPPRRRRRQSLWFWRWAVPICAISLVMWVYALRMTSKLGAQQAGEVGDALRPLSPSSLCDARLSAVLPLPVASDPEGTQSPASVYLSMRRRLYQALDDSLSSQGLRLGGERNHQGLALGDLFRVSDRRIHPVLQPLPVPVRAVVVPFADAAAAAWLHDAAQRHLVPILPEEGLWLQNSRLYHATVFHASTHAAPVLAAVEEVEREAADIRGVARRSCPMQVVLERVVATPSGSVLALWQIAAGSDPAQLRRDLRAALPNAPAEQVVSDEAILHTTLARVVAPPQPGNGQEGGGSQDPTEVLQRAVQRMTQDLCGLQTVIDTLWFVEEQDRLALALEGRFTRQAFPLECKAQQARRQRGSGPRLRRAVATEEPQGHGGDDVR